MAMQNRCVWNKVFLLSTTSLFKPAEALSIYEMKRKIHYDPFNMSNLLKLVKSTFDKFVVPNIILSLVNANYGIIVHRPNIVAGQNGC